MAWYFLSATTFADAKEAAAQLGERFLRMEEDVSELISGFGPFIAIGRPGERIPPAGAARIYLSDAHWQTAVADLISTSQLVAWQAGDTQNTWWELEQVIRSSNPRRLIMCIPNPQSRHAAFEAVRRRAADILPVRLPQCIGSATAVVFDEQWRPTMTSLPLAVARCTTPACQAALPRHQWARSLEVAHFETVLPLLIILLLLARSHAPGSQFALRRAWTERRRGGGAVPGWRTPPAAAQRERMDGGGLLANGWRFLAVVVSDNSANANGADDEGHTPLFTAVARGEAEVVNELLRRGSDVNHADGMGSTPLHLAALATADNGMIALLIDHGGNVNAVRRSRANAAPACRPERTSGPGEEVS